jgi:hypothetical protein
MEGSNEYLIMNENGMIVEKSTNFNQGTAGYITDIIHKTRSLLNAKDSINSIEIFFENQVFLVKDNCSTNLNITTVLENSK